MTVLSTFIMGIFAKEQFKVKLKKSLEVKLNKQKHTCL